MQGWGQDMSNKRYNNHAGWQAFSVVMAFLQ